jgi:hypothetical protein
MLKRRSLKTGGVEPKSAAVPAFKSKDEESTVGAQSIACAQSIADGHIGDFIWQKNKNFEKSV